MVYTAFLRGINVGGKNMVKMAELKQFVADLGFYDVVTLLQSGNVVFNGVSAEAADLEAMFESRAVERLGVRVDFFVRTSDQMDEVIAANPFPNEARAAPSHLVVYFLKSPPPEGWIESLAESYSGPEKVRSYGRRLYVCYPNGIGESKLSSAPSWRKLQSGTGRNWNTVLKLSELAKKQPG